MHVTSRKVSVTATDVSALCGAERSDYMALWKVFFDDTADGKREEVVAAGILLGRIPCWQRFQRSWNRKCREHPRIAYFHGKELSGLKKEFAQFRDKDNYPTPKDGWNAAYAKRDALRDLMCGSEVFAVGYGLRIPLYKSFREKHPKAKKYMGSDAFEYLIQLCFTQTIKELESVDSSAKVAFVGDLDEGKAERYSKVYDAWTRANPTISKRAIGISFLNDEHWPGLQGADLVATVVKKAFDETKDGSQLSNHPLAARMIKIGNVNEDSFRGVLEVQTTPHRIED